MLSSGQIPQNATTEQLKTLLHESENRFTALANASPVMLWMTDADNNCIFLNTAWSQFTGKPVKQEIENGWLKGVHPDDLEILKQNQSVFRKQKPYTIQYRLLRHDGTYRYILETGNPRFLPDGTFAGYIGSCSDITDTKNVQHLLQNQTKELLRSNEELEQFAYVTSHDLQEPLRMITSYVQIIQNNISQNKTQNLNEFIGYVMDGASRMQAMINDLLQFSRVGRSASPFTNVDLNEVVKIALSHLTNRIAENKADVSYTTMPVIMGDNFQLIRLFQNLIDNAIKFKAKDRNPQIKISVEERATDYVFGIHDNGIGIEDKFYNRIFVIFQRLHTRNEYEGTGIGLAVCKKIVERHGGEIWVQSKQNEGTTFYFTIKK